MESIKIWSRVFVGAGIALLLVVGAIVLVPQARAAKGEAFAYSQLNNPQFNPGESGSFDGGDENPPPTPVDHSQFQILQGDFKSGPEVTAACLSCHVDAADEIMHTSHWTWEYPNPDTGQILGKKNVINDFCIAIDSNEPRCTSCHAGYGWADNTFDFSAEENVDCLVCHDNTGTYKKFPTGAGHPAYEPKEFPPGSGNIWEPPDLTYVAQNVGPTSRSTCGSCHFYGGGGDGVKHGDMDSSLANPDYQLDVHMDAAGLNFKCTDCHTSEGHVVEGSRYSMNSTDEQTCETCHTAEPHTYNVLNQHVERIACQTCHIPEFARGGVPTKMWWDWSKAGDLNEDGSIKVIKDENGYPVYDSRKGEFVDEENVIPGYIWFNGQIEYTLLGDTFNPDDLLVINAPQGSLDDPSSRIWPMKVFEGTQPYDSVYQSLVIPHLFGKDDAAYWKDFDWASSIEAGMAYVGAPYSGSYDFVTTRMYWPITHMVAPAENALTCQDCHTEEGGRLDFAALGYTDEQVYGLTNFPPTSHIGTIGAISTAPDDCVECHQVESDSWSASHHGSSDVGCVSCHTLEGEGSHPEATYSISHDANTCGACHLDEYHDWQHSTHANLDNSKDPIACVDCHEPHSTEQKVPEGATTTCENCHQEQVEQMQDSTHAEEGVTCLDCHKSTDMNTGHTFTIQSDSCTQCHGEDAHSANTFAMTAAEISGQGPKEGGGETMSGAEEGQPQGANVVIPAWGYILIGLLVGATGFWVVKGKEPGSSAESQNEGSNGE